MAKVLVDGVGRKGSVAVEEGGYLWGTQKNPKFLQVEKSLKVTLKSFINDPVHLNGERGGGGVEGGVRQSKCIIF